MKKLGIDERKYTGFLMDGRKVEEDYKAMKKWIMPCGVIDNFRSNEYIASCYEVHCVTPNNNGSFYYAWLDKNSDGVFNGGDTIINDALSDRAQFRYESFHGDDVKEFTGELPHPNGYVTNTKWSLRGNTTYGSSYPVYIWEKGNNFHVADLTNQKSFTDISTVEHPNHS